VAVVAPAPGGSCHAVMPGRPRSEEVAVREASPRHGAREMDPGAAVSRARCQAARNRLLPAAAPPAPSYLHHPTCPSFRLDSMLWGAGGAEAAHRPTAGPTASPASGG